MKKYVLSLVSLLLVILGSLYIYYNTDVNKETIRVSEVTHSPFYAPWYVALDNGYFKEEGLDIEVILTSGADKVSASVLSGDVEIGFCGPESTIYIYNGGMKDYLISFAGLTKKDGQFIVSRKQYDNFDLTMLNNKEVLAGRSGGMPVINFMNALKNNNINQVKINTDVEFANLGSSFISGNGDFVNLFEPNATMLEKQGFGYIVGNIGTLSGNVPYTAFNTKLSYYNENKDIIKKFNNALNKGLAYVNSHTPEEIAKIITKEFPDISLNDLILIVKHYKDNDTWYLNTSIPEEDFKNLQGMMIDNNLIDSYVNYQKLVYDLNE